jgi:hypothetical protein
VEENGGVDRDEDGERGSGDVKKGGRDVGIGVGDGIGVVESEILGGSVGIALVVETGIEIVVDDVPVEVGTRGGGVCGDGGGGGLAGKETGLNPVFPNRSGMACRPSSRQCFSWRKGAATVDVIRKSNMTRSMMKRAGKV